MTIEEPTASTTIGPDNKSNELTDADVQIDFITKISHKKMRSDEKCDLILQRARQGHILVVEGGLDPEDETVLLERTMMVIDHEKFMGIDIYTPDSLVNIKSGFFRKPEIKLTIIAPTNIALSFKTI